MNVDVVKKELIKSSECISCAQCVVNCPSTADDLRITIFGKMVKPFIFVIAVFLMFFGSFFALNKAGLFQLTVPNLQSMKESGERLKITDLRGMMDIETGAEYVGMGLSEFYRLMEIPETVPKETMLRDVSSHVPGWDFHVIRDSR
jgi:ferredoxin